MNDEEAMAWVDDLIERAESGLAELKDSIAEWKRHLAKMEALGTRSEVQLEEIEGMAAQAKRELAHFQLFREAMTTGLYPDLTFAQVWDLTRTEAGATLH